MTEVHKKKMGGLFTKLVKHLAKEIEEGNPSDVVIKEARQLVKDFGFMLTVRQRQEATDDMEKMENVHPFPVSKKA